MSHSGQNLVKGPDYFSKKIWGIEKNFVDIFNAQPGREPDLKQHPTHLLSALVFSTVQKGDKGLKS